MQQISDRSARMGSRWQFRGRWPVAFACSRVWAVTIGLIGLAGHKAALPAGEIDFARDVRPILANHCFACHGPDRAGQENELRLDRRADALNSAIRPGNASSSLLLERVMSDDAEVRMPPPGANRVPLSTDEISRLQRWIDEGAAYTDHWSYRPPVRPPLPPVQQDVWAVNEIDRFILAQNEARQIPPAAPADRATLARRLSFDLRGLPPTRAELADFLADQTADAFARLVDRMLESEHFGERMAILWLDLVRYADTCGYHGDQHRDIDAYRDYVINAFNRNKPFDTFTIEQLAGDLLASPTAEQRIASGYNRLLQTTEEGGAQPREYRAIYNADRVRNVTSVWLGTTMGCAQCHDHKYDPFTLVDFYSMAAFFADVAEVEVGRQPANFEMPTDEQRARHEELQAQISRLQSQIQALPNADDATGQTAEAKAARVALQAQLADLQQQRDRLVGQIRRTLVTQTAPPRVTRLLPRGNWQDDSGAIVAPQAPAVFGQTTSSHGPGTRLDLARWLVDDDNPLVARVFVNHLWRVMFGQGIVRTPDDFGSQGHFPTHPELLDWLAVEFRESGWDVKQLLRQIALSNTYQQSSLATTEQWQHDPQNMWLARQFRFRFDAEVVRDNALAISGLLNRQVGGRSLKPYQPVGYWDQLNFPKRTYEPDLGDQQYRRGVYTYWCRTFLHPGMVAFDAPSREECTAKRGRSNTPLQSLVLLNDPTFVEAARGLAAKGLAVGDLDDTGRLEWLFQEALSRDPSVEELDVVRNVLQEQRERYRQDGESATKLLEVGQVRDELTSEAAPAEWAAWTAVARVLLNLHETVTRP